MMAQTIETELLLTNKVGTLSWVLNNITSCRNVGAFTEWTLWFASGLLLAPVWNEAVGVLESTCDPASRM